VAGAQINIVMNGDNYGFQEFEKAVNRAVSRAMKKKSRA